jgi:hypothetical protein
MEFNVEVHIENERVSRRVRNRQAVLGEWLLEDVLTGELYARRSGLGARPLTADERERVQLRGQEGDEH